MSSIRQPQKERKLEVALRYALNGWPVVPLWAPDCKVQKLKDGTYPCTCAAGVECPSSGKHPRTPNGVHSATTHLDEIRDWSAKYPDFNVGIACGKVSGLVVIDVDPRNGGVEALDKLGGVPGYPIEDYYGGTLSGIQVATGSGGSHFYCEYDEKILTEHKPAAGIDVQSDGLLVVAPPSVHKSGKRYMWVEAPTVYGLVAINISSVSKWAERHESSRELLKKEATDSVETQGYIPEGMRNDRLTSMGGYLRDKGLDAKGIRVCLNEYNRQRCDPPLSEKEVRGIANSVAHYKPAEIESSEANLITQVVPIRKLLSEYEEDDEEANWLLQPLIPKAGVVSIWSEPKKGKSLLMLWVAVCAAIGCGIDGSEVEPLHVLYLDFEMPKRVLRERLLSMGFAADDQRLELLDKNLHYIPLANMDTLNSQAGGKELMEAVEAYNAKLVVVDTLSKTLSGNENDAKAITEFFTLTAAPLKRRDISLVILDHSGKDPTLEQRGSSAKMADIDVAYRLTHEEAASAVTLTKSRGRHLWLPDKIGLDLRLDPTRFELQDDGSGSALEAKYIRLLDASAVDPAVATGRSAMNKLRSEGHTVNAVVFGRAFKTWKASRASEVPASALS